MNAACHINGNKQLTDTRVMTFALEGAKAPGKLVGIPLIPPPTAEWGAILGLWPARGPADLVALHEAAVARAALTNLLDSAMSREERVGQEEFFTDFDWKDGGASFQWSHHAPSVSLRIAMRHIPS